MKKLTHADFFAGQAGFTLGFESTGGIETLFFVENNPHRLDALERIFPGREIIQDVRDFLRKPELMAKYKGKIDICSGGPPCQEISTAGKGKMKKLLKGEASETEEEKRSSLWREYLEVATSLEARIIVLENVSNLFNAGLAAILSYLDGRGYNAEVQVISGRSLGSPDLRRRVCLTAWKETSYPYSDRFWPAQTGETERWKWWAEATFSLRRWWSVEPNLGRVVHGLPGKLDTTLEKERKERISSLGNSIKPQMAFIVGQQILRFNGVTEDVINGLYHSENPFWPWPKCGYEDMKNFLDE